MKRPSPLPGRARGVLLTRARFLRVLMLLAAALLTAAMLALMFGYWRFDLRALMNDAGARALFFDLRLPRVLMAGLIGATLAAVGTCLQSLFRNPLADPFTLGVSGGGALGAALAIALGWGASTAGVPVVFLAAFAGAAGASVLVYRLARGQGIVLPGTLLLAGVVMNLIAGAGVLAVQYFVDYSRALQILRWSLGSIDAIGFDLIWRMALVLVPGWLLLLLRARDLHLLATGEQAAASLGVDVRRCERQIYALSALLVGVTAAVGGTIGFVGLLVPHALRLLLGEDVRLLLPGSLLAGAAFLMLADALARTAFGSSEMPVGIITALLGGPMFLLLLNRQRRLSAL